MNTSLVTTDAFPFDPSILAGQATASTKAVYKRDFLAYLQFAQGQDPADYKTLEHWVTSLVTSQVYSPNTINRMLSSVKGVMKALSKQGYITREQAQDIKGVQGVKAKAMKDRLRPNNKVAIPPMLLRQVVDDFDTSHLPGLRNRAMFLTLASAGLRVGELVSLTREQIINKDNGYLVIVKAEFGKNQTEDKETNISAEAVAEIDRWLDRRQPLVSAYIFTSFEDRGGGRPRATPLSKVAVWQIVRREFAAYGLEGVKPHDLRRFVITEMIRRYGLARASHMARHAGVGTTMLYDMTNSPEVGQTDPFF